MTFSPATIEPQSLRITGFHYDFSATNLKYNLQFGGTVSNLAKAQIGDSFDKVDASVPGWNYATRDNVTGVAAPGILVQPPFGTDPQIIFIVSGAAGDGNRANITLESKAGIAPLSDLMIVRMTGDIFESNDAANAQELFWCGMQMIGRALGLGPSTNPNALMFPKFNTGSAMNNIVSACDIDALIAIHVTGPAFPTGVVCGTPTPPLPSSAPIPTTVGLLIGQTVYAAGEGADVSVTTGVSKANVCITLNPANADPVEFNLIADATGTAAFTLPTGGPLGLGVYTVDVNAKANGFNARAAQKTFEVF